MEFYDGAILITGVKLNSMGEAVLDYANLPVGTDSLTAVYKSNSDYATSTSTAVSQMVE